MYAPPNASSIAAELHDKHCKRPDCSCGSDNDRHNFLQGTKQVCDRASNYKPSSFKLGIQ